MHGMTGEELMAQILLNIQIYEDDTNSPSIGELNGIYGANDGDDTDWRSRALRNFSLTCRGLPARHWSMLILRILDQVWKTSRIFAYTWR